MKTSLLHPYLVILLVMPLFLNIGCTNDEIIEEKNTYVVKFIDHNGALVDSQTVEENGKLNSYPSPPRLEGHDFKGWFYDDGKEFDLLTTITSNIALTAKWKIKTYDAVFITDIEGYNNSQTIKVNYGETIDESKVYIPYAEKYKFIEWQIDDNDKFEFSHIFKENETITSVWVKQYLVSFFSKRDDVKPIYSFLVDENKGLDLTQIKNPSRPNHLFLEWHTEDVKFFDLNKLIRADMNIYGSWSKVDPGKTVFSVSFDLDGGSGYFPRLDFQKDEPVRFSKKPPIKEGFEFIEWQSEGKRYKFGQPIKKNLILKPLWGSTKEGERIVKVYFDTSGGNPIESQSIKQGGRIKIPKTPIKKGYDFNEWVYDGLPFDLTTPITKRITVKATWKDIELKVKILDNNGSHILFEDTSSGKTLDYIKVLYNGRFPKIYINQVPHPSNYKFSHFVTLDGKVFNEGITQDITLKIAWRVFFVVKFDSNGGSTIDPSEVKKEIFEGESLMPPETPKKTGYMFRGWRTPSGDYFNFDTTPIRQNYLLVADWQLDDFSKKNYKVTIKTLGGTTSLDPYLYFEEGDIITEPVGKAKRDGYKFAGWTDESGEQFIFGEPIVRDIVLSAYWKKIYTITFDTLGGTSIKPIKVVEGESLYQSPDYVGNPSKLGSFFIGWRNAYDFSNFSIDTPITSDLKLEPIWEVEDIKKTYYFVTFITGNGGTIIDPIKVEKDKRIYGVGTPIKAEHIFIEWIKVDNTAFDISKDVVTKNLALTAVWRSERHKVTFKDGSDTISEISVKDGEKIKGSEFPTPPNKEGAKFVEWRYLGSAFDFNQRIVKDIEITPFWENLYNTVSFMINEKVVKSEKVPQRSQVTVPTPPVKSGYTFLGWIDSKGMMFDFDNTDVYENITLKAKFSSNPPTTGVNPNTDRVLVAYFSLDRETMPDNNSNSFLRETPSFVTHLVLTYAKPNLEYKRGSNDVSKTGLNLSSYNAQGEKLTCMLKQSIEILKRKNIKVLLGLGGDKYWKNVSSQDINYSQIKDLVDDFGFDGVDWSLIDTQGRISDLGNENYISLYTSLIDNTRQLMPKGQYIISCKASSVGALGGITNDDNSSPFAYSGRNNITPNIAPNLVDYLFELSETGHMIPVLTASGDKIDIVCYQVYGDINDGKRIIYDSYAYYANKYNFTLAFGAVNTVSNGGYLQNNELVADISSYILSGGKQNLRSQSEDGIMINNVSDNTMKPYSYLYLSNRVFKGADTRTAISEAKSYPSEPFSGTNNCNIIPDPQSDLTFCDNSKSWIHKAYEIAGVSVYYKGSIYRNKWKTDASMIPGKDSVWEYQEECNTIKLSTPTNLGKDMPLNTRLSWLRPTEVDDTYTLEYNVYLGLENPPTTLVATTTDTNFNSAKLNGLKTYYWYIKATVSSVELHSEVREFRTQKKKQIFTVSFDTRGGSSINPISIQEGNTLNRFDITTTKSDSVFNRWADEYGNEFDISTTPIQRDLKLIAIWLEDEDIDCGKVKPHEHSKEYLKGEKTLYNKAIWEATEATRSTPNTSNKKWARLNTCDENDDKNDNDKDDNGKNDNDKNDNGKNDDDKNDNDKDDNGKNDNGKNDNDKNDNGKNDDGKDDNGKDDNDKNDNGKDDNGKDDNGKDDNGKNDNGKNDNGKNDNGKDDNGKNDDGKDDNDKNDNGKDDNGKDD